MVDSNDVLTALFIVCTMIVAIVAIYTRHQRKLMQMQLLTHQAPPQLSAGTVDGLEQDFLTLRESLTAHAMSMDENVKALAARLNSVESRVVSVENGTQQSTGAGSAQ